MSGAIFLPARASFAYGGKAEGTSPIAGRFSRSPDLDGADRGIYGRRNRKGLPQVEIRVERRMGPVGSENWHAMLDGAEHILREEGHAALTSRRVAERIGVKQRLIYYYFRTMDDLVVHMFHRLSERALARLQEAATGTAPLREIWDICINTADARLVAEFMALAHRIEALREEVRYFIETSRSVQVEALEAAMKRSGWSGAVPARSLALIATSLGLSLPREAQVGVTTGHAETLEVIAAMFEQLEPGGA